MFGGRKVRSNKGVKRGPYGHRTKRRKTRSNKGIKRGPYLRRIKSKKIRSIKKKISNISNNLNNNSCKIIDVNGNYQVLNKEYPGNEWVHEHLMENRDIDLKYYQRYHPEKLTETYHRYLDICNM